MDENKTYPETVELDDAGLADVSGGMKVKPIRDCHVSSNSVKIRIVPFSPDTKQTETAQETRASTDFSRFAFRKNPLRTRMTAKQKAQQTKRFKQNPFGYTPMDK